MFCHVRPPSRDMLTVPSSVPVKYTPGCRGDSARETIAGHCEMPSFREMLIWSPRSPIVTIESRDMFFVRSGLITVHESPRSVDLKTRFAATSSVPGSFGESIIGESQWKRKLSPGAGAGVTFVGVGRMFFDSPVTVFRRIMLPFCDSV